MKEVISKREVMWFFCQAEDGIRDLVRSRGLGDVYKRQEPSSARPARRARGAMPRSARTPATVSAHRARTSRCLLYTSDAAAERSSVDLGGRRII